MIIKVRRGLEANRTAFTPVVGEPIFTTDTKKLYIGDGVTPGGIEVDMGSSPSDAPVQSVAGRAGHITLVKADVGLANVNNTSDLDKPVSNATQNALNSKVDKETGKGLSTNDYTTADRNKLAGVASNANNYVHPTTHSADIITDGATNKAYTAAEKTKLANIASGAEVNVQPDWNQTSSAADDFIKHKPTIPSQLAELLPDSTHRTVTDTEKATWNNKVDKVTGKGLSTNDYSNTEKTKLAGIAAGAEVNVNPDWDATSGDAQILNKPTIPTKVSDLENDADWLHYQTDIDSPDYYYFAHYLNDGTWRVQRLSREAPFLSDYATIVNNSEISDIIEAYTNRQTLTYTN